MTDQKPTNNPPNFSPWEGSSVFVEQGRQWSSAFIWLSASMFGGALLWAFTAKVDQTITVSGKLAPISSVTVIESPSSGVVKSVFINEGDFVNTGDKLLSVESEGLSSRLETVKQSLQIINFELEAFKALINSDGDSSSLDQLPIISQDIDPDLRQKLLSARNQTLLVATQLEQLETRITSKQRSLELLQNIADDMKPLFESGGLARNSYLQQLNRLQEYTAELSNLKGERTRIIGTITASVNQLNKQQLRLRSELVSINEQIAYRTVVAPADGKVFDLRARAYSVVSNSQPLLKIVPDTGLLANVRIPNSDIGFVKVGQPVSVSVDSFPSGEFGYIQGILRSIGSDSLPPDSTSNAVYFPGVVSLRHQKVQTGSQYLNLQSGMSISANIKLRSRPAITIMTDIFTRQLDGVKRFR